MGTQDPLVHIEAATLAGSDNNQDRYAYGDGWAFVLDGATSFSDTPPVHDGGWYAERLKNALARHLEAADHNSDTASIVAHAIEDAAAEHDNATQGPCPTSTIALTRWNNEQVELYVLGDSFAVAIPPDGETTVLTDDRIKQFGDEYRQDTRQRLSQGSGFDPTHTELLRLLQVEQTHHRNILNGYWIAGALPNAAEHARRLHLPLRDTSGLILASDGFTTLATPQWKRILHQSLREVDTHLYALHNAEANDATGIRFPRSKLHDDKTIILIRLNPSSAPTLHRKRQDGC